MPRLGNECAKRNPSQSRAKAIADCLLDQARQRPDAVAAVDQYEILIYHELLGAAVAVARGLAACIARAAGFPTSIEGGP